MIMVVDRGKVFMVFEIYFQFYLLASSKDVMPCLYRASQEYIDLLNLGK
jgi:hypothetical protein